MKRLKVGIIGQGRSGRDIHAQWIKTMPEKFEIVAVADPLEDRQEQARKEMNCGAYPDLKTMLKRHSDIDLVVNAAPSHLHIPLTEEALDSGFNVLSDKPFGRKAADVDRLAAKAKKAGRLLAVFQQSRFAAYFQQVKAVCDSGVLGRIVMVKVFFNGFARRWDWQTLRRMDGGSLLNTGPHPLDQVLHFIGRDAMPNVLCIMDKVNTFGDAEDHVKMILTRKGYPTVDYEVSSCSSYNPYTYQVYGSRGSLAGTQTHIEWKYFKDSEAPQQKLISDPMPNRAYCSEQLAWHEEKWDASKDFADNSFSYMTTRLYGNVYDVLCSGAELEVKLEHVRQQIAIVEEAHRQNGSYAS
ncbi:MAG: oxidoreductase [Lentisphaerae bacterium GWF2_52_8]|nr:MAG: oxidoreductase [Lentisphaerae bacterium GWF2_52_8]